MRARLAGLLLIAASAALPTGVTAASDRVAPTPRITQAIDERDTVTLRGNVHPLLREASASAPVDPASRLDDLILTLRASPAQEAALARLIQQQSDPHSSHYHQFLTPAQFAARFGVASSDIARTVAWLQGHGLEVKQVPQGNRSIIFGGRVDQVATAFQTEIRDYRIRGEHHLANATDPRIPAALAAVVGGVVKLNDFRHQAFFERGTQTERVGAVTPDFAPSGLRWLVPGDYAAIYDTNPLLVSGVDGSGQSIAVIARSDIYLSDVQGFRSLFGLKNNDPQFVITNSDPGQVNGDNVETTLDTEWAGAVAPGAGIKVIISASGAGSDGIDLSSQYAVSNNVAPIITVSYGSCEAALGATELSFYNSLWQQASAQGQTVLVASGDSGAAGCDAGNTKTASNGKGVNGLCSSPYSTCVGGTQFADTSNPALYWYGTGPGTTTGSAMGYIPEAAWNESGSVNGGGGLWSGGGGASTVYAKPAWQTGTGVPNDQQRDVPDVSLTAASHDGYTVVQGGAIGFLFSVGGTSAATPSFAGIMALVNQKNGSAQGNINPVLYSLAAQSATQVAPVFHDVINGSNTVPGITGYNAGKGYDLATGLGSVDANNLATLWSTATATPASLTLSASPLALNAGKSGSVTVATLTNGLNADVSLSVSGLPTGVSASFSSATIAAPGAGSVTLNVVAASSVAPGLYTLTLTAAGGGQTATTTIDLTITVPTFTLSYGGGLYPSVNFGPIAPYTAQKINLQTFPANGFNSKISFSVTGLPTGLTVSFSPASVSGSSVGSSVATVSAASTIKGGSYSFTIVASGGGVTQSVTYSANVFVQPSCTLTPDQYSLAFKAGNSAAFKLTCTASKSNNNPVTLSLSGLPGGVTGKFSAATVTANHSVTLTLSSTNGVNPGTYPLTVTGSEPSGAVQTLCLYAAISTPVFTLSLNPGTVKAKAGTTVQFTAVITPDAGFNSPITVWIGGRPNGVNASFGTSSIANPSTTITLTIDPSTTRGNYPLTVGANAATGYSRIVNSTLTIQ